MTEVIPQSGAICLVGDEIVLVTSRAGSRWVIPKGHLEAQDSSALERARAEAWEEAGVSGQAQSEPCGHFHYSKKGSLYRVEVFLLRFCQLADEWPEMEQRTRILISPTEAAKLVQEPELKRLLSSIETFDTGAPAWKTLL